MAWFDANYGYKKKITLNNAKIAGDEVDFPVLISVTDGDLADEANGGQVKSANGYDIIFTNGAEDTLLKHEIERYTNTNGTLVYWVKVPSLSSTPPSTDIYIYYGKAGVGADPSTKDTWDANFIAVYHMDSNDATLDDSTENRDATKDANDEPERIEDKIGYGQDFELDDTEKALAAKVGAITSMTVECWYKPETNTTTHYMIVNTNIAAAGQISFFLWRNTSKKLLFNVQAGVAWMVGLTSVNNLENGTSYHCAGVLDDENYGRVFIDGAQEATDDIITGDMNNHASAILLLGADKLDAIPTYRHWCDGVMDEVRISDSPRSNNWINTTYETQDDPANFLTFGAEEVSATGADIYYHDGTNNIELQRDDTSPVQMYNGTNVIGLKIGATDDANASPIHVWDGTTIKAILKMP